jgi:hypothetical protein
VVAGQRIGCNMISAITNRGAGAFMVFQGKFQHPAFIEFMNCLLRQVKGKLYLIVNGHLVHRSGVAKRFVADDAGGAFARSACRAIAPNGTRTSCSIRM